MAEISYSVSYLPIFYHDLEEHVTYIKDVLLNDKAANELVDEVEKAIIKRIPVAESFEPYRSVKKRKYPYYRIYVRNYTIYYVVIPSGDNTRTVEIRRILHNRQDRRKFL